VIVTTQHTAAILRELRRIGVDLDALPEPLVGTGLRAGETLDWLGAIPDGAGAAELLRRLDERLRRALGEHMVSVRWRIEAPHPRLRPPRQRDWPTQPLLDAGTELMIEEWDPFGMRLASADRETIAMFVFHFFGPLLAPNGMIDAITHTTGMIASAERDRLGLTPSPEPHRRYLAVRLRELAEQYPVPPVKERPPQALVVVVGDDGSGPPPLDPEGVCVRCHAFGTVARVTVQSKPPRISRFCAAWRKEVRSEYMSHEPPRPPTTAHERIAFKDRSQRPATSAESRSWDDTIDFIRLILAAREDPKQQQTIAPAALAEIAAGVSMKADKMDGEMPADVEAFVRQFSVST
jgi:hypothetical protein